MRERAGWLVGFGHLRARCIHTYIRIHVHIHRYTYILYHAPLTIFLGAKSLRRKVAASLGAMVVVDCAKRRGIQGPVGFVYWNGLVWLG